MNMNHGFSVTSSEKVDKENRYSEFEIMAAPYPGCEFFREWRDNGYMAEGMMFDWSQVCIVHILSGHDFIKQDQGAIFFLHFQIGLKHAILHLHM